MYEFLIISLAVWRLSSLIVTPEDDGPWEMFMRIRLRMGVRYDTATGTYYGTNILARMLTCVWCTSVWVGMAFGIAYFLWGIPTMYVAFPLALSSGAILMERMING